MELVRRNTADVAEVADVFLAHWCASHQSGSLRGASENAGFFATWRVCAMRDPDLRRIAGRNVGDCVGALPDDAAATVADLLQRLGVGEDDAVAYIEAQLTRLPGWAAAMARRNANGHRRAVVSCSQCQRGTSTGYDS